MEKRRVIKKYSGVWMIKLNPTDAKDLNLEVGDEADISEIKIIKNPKEVQMRGRPKGSKNKKVKEDKKEEPKVETKEEKEKTD